MFSKIAIFALASAAAVIAGPAPKVVHAPTKGPPVTIDQCNTGNVQCCNSTQEVNGSTSPSASIPGLIGVVVQGVDALIGLGCTPISVIGIGSGVSCTQQPICCEGNTFNGLINIGCSPITI